MDLTTRAYLLGGFVLFIIVTALVVLAIGKKIQTDSDAADTFDVGKDMKKEQRRKAKEEKKLAKQEAKASKTKSAPKEKKSSPAATQKTSAPRSGVKPLVANGVATSASALANNDESFDDFSTPATTGFGQAAKAPSGTVPPPAPAAFAPAPAQGNSIYDSPEARMQTPNADPAAAPTPSSAPAPATAPVSEKAPKLPPKDPNAASPFATGNSGEDEW